MERSRPGRDPRGAGAVLLATLATMLSLGAFGSMLEPPIWSGPLLWLPGLVGLAMALVAWLRWPAWGVAAAGAGAFVLVSPSLGSPGLGWSPVGVVRLWIEAVPEAQSATRPAEITAPIAALVAGIAALLVVVAAVLAHARLGLLAALPAIGLWAVPLASGLDVSLVLLLANFILILVMVAVASRSSLTATSGVGALGVSVLAVAAAFVAGPVVVASSPPALPVLDFAGSEPRALSRDLDLRDDLSSDSSRVAVTYTSDDGPVDVLRLFSVDIFDGATWEPMPTRLSDGEPVGPGYWTWQQYPGAWGDETARVEITLESIAETRLPIVAGPAALRTDVNALYLWSQDELAPISSTGASPGATYALDVAVSPPTPEDLVASPAFDWQGIGDADIPWIEVPGATDPGALDAALAHAFAVDGADPSTPYGAALAIQNWLRDPAEFAYDDSVELAQDDAVTAFLDERRGYCTHFATTMAVMARSLGIPARLGVGFQGGVRTGPHTYEVAWSQAHAWPELFFDGIGWVRFEPTPALHTGSAPDYAADENDPGESTPTPSPSVSPSITASPSLSSTPAASPTGSPLPSASTTAAESGAYAEEDGGGPSWWWALVPGTLLVAAGIAFGVRRASRAPDSPAAAWAWLMRRLPSDVRPASNLTIRRARDAIVARSEEAGRPLSPRMRASLDRLADAAERESFGPPYDGAAVLSAGEAAAELLEELRVR